MNFFFKRQKKWRILFVVFFSFFVCVYSNKLPGKIVEISKSSGSSESNVVLENLQKKYQKTKEKILQGEIKQRKLLSEIYKINLKLKKQTKIKSNLNSRQEFLKERIQENLYDIQKLQVKLKNKKNNFFKSMNFWMKIQNNHFLAMLFSSQSSYDFDNNYKVLGFVLQKDWDKISEYENLRKLNLKKQKILKKNLKKYRKNADKLNKEEKQITLEYRKKKDILKELKKIKKVYLKELEEVKDESLNLIANKNINILNQFFNPSIIEKKGNLWFPIKGEIYQDFGAVKDKSYKTYFRHKGLFLTAGFKSKVFSVFSGKVVFKKFIRGFGKTIIIDHGDHYYSVYANIEEYVVVENQKVKQNELIAFSGRSFSNIEGLYFEIRHFSEPENPHEWLKRELDIENELSTLKTLIL